MAALRYLGGDVYMAYGKVFRIADPSVDVLTDSGRQEVLLFAAGLFESKLMRRSWGVLTAGIMYPKVDGPRGPKHVASSCPFSALCDDAKAVLREEYPEYADRI